MVEELLRPDDTEEAARPAHVVCHCACDDMSLLRDELIGMMMEDWPSIDGDETQSDKGREGWDPMGIALLKSQRVCSTLFSDVTLRPWGGDKIHSSFPLSRPSLCTLSLSLSRDLLPIT